MYDFIFENQKGNELHRDQLIRDMIYVCCLPGLSAKSRREFLDKAIIWPLSDKGKENINKPAKYKGCKYWSIEAYEKHIKPFENAALKGFSVSDLVHEHVVPKRIFINTMEKYFEDIRANTPYENIEDKMNEVFDKLKTAISKNLYSCVITNDENKNLEKKFRNRMPNNEEDFFEIKHPWDRYTETGYTELYEVQWKPRTNKKGEDITGWLYDGAKKVKIDDIH